MNYLDKFRNFKKKVKDTLYPDYPAIENAISLNKEEIDELIQYYETDDDRNYNQKLIDILKRASLELDDSIGYNADDIRFQRVISQKSRKFEKTKYLAIAPEYFDDKTIKELNRIGFYTKKYNSTINQAGMKYREDDINLEVRWNIK